MSETENKKVYESDSSGRSHESNVGAPLESTVELISREVPQGVDRRTFLMRSAVVTSAVMITGNYMSAQEMTQRSSAVPPLSPDLDVVKQEKGPVLTTVDEFYKVGPGPSSSHTIGPMRITYDFYQRCTKLPADQLKQATGLKVHLFGSLSATGKGHCTESAALAVFACQEARTGCPLVIDAM